MNKWLKKLRKIVWILHESMSMLGFLAWADHRIQEIDEAIEELREEQK